MDNADRAANDELVAALRRRARTIQALRDRASIDNSRLADDAATQSQIGRSAAARCARPSSLVVSSWAQEPSGMRHVPWQGARTSLSASSEALSLSSALAATSRLITAFSGPVRADRVTSGDRARTVPNVARRAVRRPQRGDQNTAED